MQVDEKIRIESSTESPSDSQSLHILRELSLVFVTCFSYNYFGHHGKSNIPS